MKGIIFLIIALIIFPGCWERDSVKHLKIYQGETRTTMGLEISLIDITEAVIEEADGELSPDILITIEINGDTFFLNNGGIAKVSGKSVEITDFYIGSNPFVELKLVSDEDE